MRIFRRVLVLVLLVTAGMAGVKAEAQPGAEPEARADAYYHFLMARFHEARGEAVEALRALERAAELDEAGAEIRAELASLHARQNRIPEALAAAHAALDLDPATPQAHRVLGTIYGALAEAPGLADSREVRERHLAQAVLHLELAGAEQGHDPALQLTLGRLYTRAGAPAKAIPLLVRLLEVEGWAPEVVILLAQAYGGAGRRAEAISLLEQALEYEPRFHRGLVLLAEIYERERRWEDAAAAFERAAAQDSRSAQLRVRHAMALLNGGQTATARDVLLEATEAHPSEATAFYLLAQAERQLRNLDEAERAARRVIDLDERDLRGPLVLAEVFELRRQPREIVETLEPVTGLIEGERRSRLIGRLFGLLAAAYQALDDHERAVAAYERAAVFLGDPATGEAQVVAAMVAAGRLEEALEAAREAQARHGDDFRFVHLEAQALQAGNRGTEAIRVLEGAVRRHDEDAASWIALARLYMDLDRLDEAGRVLASARDRFPKHVGLAFQTGAFHDRRQQFEEAEGAFRRVLAQDPQHAPALNHLGYMLAERGERLEESVRLIERALALDPHNGAYLDSLGWAYFKLDRLDLAERYLRQAARQLESSSVVQDHLGELLYRRGAYDEAVEAWQRALQGDGTAVDRSAIESKIRRARQEAGGR